jgi:hypothetical protein
MHYFIALAIARVGSAERICKLAGRAGASRTVSGTGNVLCVRPVASKD